MERSGVNYRSKIIGNNDGEQKLNFEFLDLGINYNLSSKSKLDFAVYNVSYKTINNNSNHDITYNGGVTG